METLALRDREKKHQKSAEVIVFREKKTEEGPNDKGLKNLRDANMCRESRQLQKRKKKEGYL